MLSTHVVVGVWASLLCEYHLSMVNLVSMSVDVYLYM